MPTFPPWHRNGKWSVIYSDSPTGQWFQSEVYTFRFYHCYVWELTWKTLSNTCIYSKQLYKFAIVNGCRMSCSDSTRMQCRKLNQTGCEEMGLISGIRKFWAGLPFVERHAWPVHHHNRSSLKEDGSRTEKYLSLYAPRGLSVMEKAFPHKTSPFLVKFPPSVSKQMEAPFISSAVFDNSQTADCRLLGQWPD